MNSHVEIQLIISHRTEIGTMRDVSIINLILLINNFMYKSRSFYFNLNFLLIFYFS